MAPDSTYAADLLCIACGYPLTGLQIEGRCPECGTALRDTIGTFAQPDALARGIDLLRYGYICCFALLLAGAAWIAAVVSLTAACLAMLAVFSLFFTAKLALVASLRNHLLALGVSSVALAAIPLGLALLNAHTVLVAYLAAALVLVSALLASWLGSRVARPIGYEGIIHQLRSQRLIIYAAAASSVILAASIGGAPIRPLAIVHFGILAALGVIALGHTLVAFAQLSRAVRIETSESR